MKKELHVNRALFWEIDEKKIQSTIKTNPDVSIPRIFTRGTMGEIKDMIDYYGFDTVKEILKEQLSKQDLRILNLACLIFKLKKTDFQCYKNKAFRHIY